MPLGTQISESVTTNILAQTYKPKLAQYLHAEIFSPTTAILLNSIKKGFLKTWPGLTENIIKKHLEKLSNTKMGHLYMRIQGLKSTKYKPPDTDLEDKSKTNVVLCINVDSSTTKEGNFTHIYVDASPPHQSG